MITDLPEQPDLIQANILTNCPPVCPDEPHPKRLTAAPLHWGRAQAQAFRAAHPHLPAVIEVILASEILYLAPLHDVLLETLDVLSTPGNTRNYIAYKYRALGEEAFFRKARAAGFTWEEVGPVLSLACSLVDALSSSSINIIPISTAHRIPHTPDHKRRGRVRPGQHHFTVHAQASSTRIGMTCWVPLEKWAIRRPRSTTRTRRSPVASAGAGVSWPGALGSRASME